MKTQECLRTGKQAYKCGNIFSVYRPDYHSFLKKEEDDDLCKREKGFRRKIFKKNSEERTASVYQAIYLEKRRETQNPALHANCKPRVDQRVLNGTSPTSSDYEKQVQLRVQTITTSAFQIQIVSF